MAEPFSAILKRIRGQGWGLRIFNQKEGYKSLVSVFPARNQKYRVVRRISEKLAAQYFFHREKEVKNFYLAKHLKTRAELSGSLRISKREYLNNKATLDIKLKNVFRAIRKYWKPLGYSVRFGKYSSKIIEITPNMQNRA